MQSLSGLDVNFEDIVNSMKCAFEYNFRFKNETGPRTVPFNPAVTNIDELVLINDQTSFKVVKFKGEKNNEFCYEFERSRTAQQATAKANQIWNLNTSLLPGEKAFLCDFLEDIRSGQRTVKCEYFNSTNAMFSSLKTNLAETERALKTEITFRDNLLLFVQQGNSNLRPDFQRESISPVNIQLSDKCEFSRLTYEVNEQFINYLKSNCPTFF